MSATGAFELKMLGLAVIIGLAHIVLAAVAAHPQRGIEWNVGPRDEPRPLTGVAGRLERASANFRETFPFFAAALIAAYLFGKIGPLTYWGSMAYVAARLAYVPLYAFGVPYLRSLVWAVGTGGIVAILVAIFR